ncbi:hypothetical protein [Fibrella aquatilis]|uniref:Uncharacterized protein n=1 Tax=Fibrella aquatilis TaxID=2817059 RepID=A0A939G1X4_9BACT|nr:hypothetical protein [Fibrella aquatilis]MBO0930361.1 hypothetical protein [Fibrella aquatilis]
MTEIPLKYILTGLAVSAILAYLSWSAGGRAGTQAGTDYCTQNLFPNA